MFLHVRAIPHREPIDIDLFDEPALHERVEAIIYRGHRNVRHPLLGPHKDLLGGGMVAFLEHDAVNVLTLGGGTKPPASEPFSELFCMDATLHKGTVAQEPLKSIVGIILNLNKPCKLFFVMKLNPPVTGILTLAPRSKGARPYSPKGPRRAVAFGQ